MDEIAKNIIFICLIMTLYRNMSLSVYIDFCHITGLLFVYYCTVFLPRDALQCKARSWDRMSSVRPSVRLSVCNVGGLWWHRLEFFENNFTVS